MRQEGYLVALFFRLKKDKKPKNKMTRICIYHANCPDGFAAATVVYHRFGRDEVEYIPANYGDTPPDVTGKDVIIVDFSYPIDVLISMYDKANSLVVLDHHKTAKKHLEGWGFCKFDDTKCGAVLAWEHFFEGFNIPLFLKYIQDRDLWQWKLPQSREVSAALDIEERELHLWRIYLETDDNVRFLIQSGEKIVRYQDTQITRAMKEARMIEFEGYTVPILNCTTLVSETLGKLAKEHPFAIGYMDLSDCRHYSLRSDAGTGIDVSAIAEKHGGGGHPNSAGFSKPLNFMV